MGQRQEIEEASRKCDRVQRPVPGRCPEQPSTLSPGPRPQGQKHLVGLHTCVTCHHIDGHANTRDLDRLPHRPPSVHQSELAVFLPYSGRGKPIDRLAVLPRAKGKFPTSHVAVVERQRPHALAMGKRRDELEALAAVGELIEVWRG